MSQKFAEVVMEMSRILSGEAALLTYQNFVIYCISLPCYGIDFSYAKDLLAHGG
jgi:hypothetical protein